MQLLFTVVFAGIQPCFYCHVITLIFPSLWPTQMGHLQSHTISNTCCFLHDNKHFKSCFTSWRTQPFVCLYSKKCHWVTMLLLALILCSYRAFIFPLLPDKRVTSRSLFMPPALQMENLKGRILFQTLDGQIPLWFISPIYVDVVVHVLRQSNQ